MTRACRMGREAIRSWLLSLVWQLIESHIIVRKENVDVRESKSVFV